MSRVTMYQSNFTVGEIDPLVIGRTDIQQYASGLQKAQNVVILPQGGFERRPGLRFMFDLTSHLGPTFTTLDGIRLIPFEFSTSESFMLAFVKFSVVETRMFVFGNGQQITNLNGSSNPYIQISAFGDIDLDRMYFTQSADTLIVVHEDMSPVSIVRGATNTNWTVSTIDLTAPKHAFTIVRAGITSTDQSSDYTFPFVRRGASANISADPVSGSVTITAVSNIFLPGITGTVSSATTNVQINISGGSSLADAYNGRFFTITGGTGAGQKRIIADYTQNVVTVSEAFSPIPDGTSTFEISDLVDQYIVVKDGFGRAKIVEVISQTVVKATTEFPFFEVDKAIPSNEWEFEFGHEDAVSDSRGFFRTCTFHEGRLYFGGSKSLPNTLFGSKINDFFNLKSAEALDDDAIFVTIATDTVNAITAMRSGRDLQIFTTNAEFFVPQADLDPITPSNIVIKNATRRGAKEGLKPVSAEGGTLFIQRECKAIREFLFSDVDLSYQANNISLLASHLIKSPRSMALRVATSTDDGDLLLIPNDTDGTMAVFSILRSQNVVAPSEFVTDGKFLDVAVDVSDIYVVTERVLPTGVVSFTITVSDYQNIAVDTQIVFKKNDGTTFTAQSQASGASQPSAPSGNTHFFRPHGNNNTTAINIRNAINAISGFTATVNTNHPNSMFNNVVTVVRDGTGTNNLAVTSSDTTRLAVTNFVQPTKRYLELFDDQRTTDANIQYFANATAPDQSLPGNTTCANLSHLEGNTVDVIRDDIVEDDKTVSSGSITISQAPSTFVEVGLTYNVEVKTLPAEPRLPSGVVSSRKKRIVEVTPIVDRTQNLAVNGFEVPFEDLPLNLNVKRTVFTGRKRVSALLGYSETEQLTFTMTQPLFATVLGVEYKLSTGS